MLLSSILHQVLLPGHQHRPRTRATSDHLPSAEQAIAAARADRLAWISYPKGGQLGTDLNRDLLLESRQKERSGGHSPRRPTAGAGGQASQRLPSADPDRQLPPDHRAHCHTAKAARRRLPRPPLPVRGHCRAINVPLAAVTRGLSRILRDSSPRGSGHMTARTAQIPKLIVRVRFPSPALQRNTRSAAHAGLWYPVRWCVGDDRVPLTCHWPTGTTRPEAKLGLGLIFMGNKVAPQ